MMYNMFHASFTEIPPEILKIVCKTLSWQDIKFLEEVFLSNLFLKSIVKSDVISRALPLYKKLKDNKIWEKKYLIHYTIIISF